MKKGGTNKMHVNADISQRKPSIISYNVEQRIRGVMGNAGISEEEIAYALSGVYVYGGR